MLLLQNKEVQIFSTHLHKKKKYQPVPSWFICEMCIKQELFLLIFDLYIQEENDSSLNMTKCISHWSPDNFWQQKIYFKIHMRYPMNTENNHKEIAF